MSVSFALGGFRSRGPDGQTKVVTPPLPAIFGGGTSDPITGRVPRAGETGRQTGGGGHTDRPQGPDTHAVGGGSLSASGVSGGGDGTTGSDPGAPVDQGGDPGTP